MPPPKSAAEFRKQIAAAQTNVAKVIAAAEPKPPSTQRRVPPAPPAPQPAECAGHQKPKEGEGEKKKGKWAKGWMFRLPSGTEIELAFSALGETWGGRLYVPKSETAAEYETRASHTSVHEVVRLLGRRWAGENDPKCPWYKPVTGSVCRSTDAGAEAASPAGSAGTAGRTDPSPGS